MVITPSRSHTSSPTAAPIETNSPPEMPRCPSSGNSGGRYDRVANRSRSSTTPRPSPNNAESQASVLSLLPDPGTRSRRSVNNGAPRPIFFPRINPDAASGMVTAHKTRALGPTADRKFPSNVPAKLPSCVNRVRHTSTMSGSRTFRVDESCC